MVIDTQERYYCLFGKSYKDDAIGVFTLELAKNSDFDAFDTHSHLTLERDNKMIWDNLD